MTTRDDVTRLADASRQLVEMARRDLEQMMATINMADSVAARDALLEIVPALVREYGTVAASAAADWYEGLRSAAGIQSPHDTMLSAGANLDAVAGSTKYAMTRPDPRSILFGAIQRYISYSARDTIRRNAANDRSRPRYGRVPTGAKTCAFCEMLASRGFVYHSQATAGDKARAGFGTDFHDDCVVAGTVVSGPTAVAATSRIYKGEVVTLAAGGNEVTVTPNHPILTARGWVRAQFVNEFDYLFVTESVSRVIRSRPDEYEGPARVEDRFAALAMEKNAAWRSMPGAPEQFHGDGFDSEVNIVSSDGLLWDELHSLVTEELAESGLALGTAPCPVHSGFLPPKNRSDLRHVRLGRPSHGGVSRSDLLDPFFTGHKAGAHLAGGAHAALLDSSLLEPSRNGSSRNALDLSNGVLAFPGQVPARDIIRALDPIAPRRPVSRICRSYYTGHVFNISTATHWYSANSIVTHNCDCQIVVEWDADTHHIAGYNPDAMYARYVAARATQGPHPSTQGILASMRRMNPGAYTDGVFAN